jgi:hypothetical protein
MIIETVRAKRILLSPLNWGQGHVYRSIALIQLLLSQDNILFIACNDSQKEIYQRYLGKEVTFYQIEGYDFKFSINNSLVIKNIFRFPILLKQHFIDRQICDKIVEKEKIDLVISDHRYGFYSKNVSSIFMTHQCQLPINNKSIQKLHQRLVNKHFSSVWIIDNEDHSLAGKLSKPVNINIPTHYLGLLSRFKNAMKSTKKDKIVAVISGPFPYNQLLLDIVKEYAQSNKIEIYCITNLECNAQFLIPVAVDEHDSILLQAKIIISHSGYTTLMDIDCLKPERAILIPAPQQLEQQYLALHNDTKFTILKEYKDLLQSK